MQASLSADALQARLGDSADEFPPLPWTLLSESAASFVFDLHDGSLIKAVKKRGGISSGEARWRREAAMLRALDGMDASAVKVPHLTAMGECDSGGFLDIPLAGWLRIEKCAGRAYSFDAFSILPLERRERMGERLGAAIASLHQAGEDRVEACAILGDPIARQMSLSAQSLPTPQDFAHLKRLEALWAEGARSKTILHGNLSIENVLWGEGDAISLTGWSEAGAGDPVSDLAHFEPFGALRDAIFRGYTARAGARPDMLRYRQAVAARAFVTLATEGDQGHPREGMRRRRMLEEYLYQAGIE